MTLTWSTFAQYTYVLLFIMFTVLKCYSLSPPHHIEMLPSVIVSEVSDLLSNLVYNTNHVTVVKIKYRGARRPYGMIVKVVVKTRDYGVMKTIFRIRNSNQLEFFRKVVSYVEEYCLSFY